MLADAVGYLRCPHCEAGLSLAGGSMRCAAGHSFDVARQGYVSLLPGDARAGTADTPAMVRARASFLGAGHYSAIERAVAAEAERAIAGQPEGCVVDVGAGTGHYLARSLDQVPGRVGLALDISKHALRRAARAHPRIGAVACDVWGPLPVRAAAAGVVLSVFAPRNGAEIGRVLGPGGALVVVTPTLRHLAELTPALELLAVDERKRERLDAQLDPFVTPLRRRSIEEPMWLEHADIEALVGMGPSARHSQEATLAERIRALPEPLTVTASVTVSVYARRPRD